LTTPPFRFGLSGSGTESAAAWVDHARSAEAAGYDVLLVADHFGLLDPMVALQAAASVTDRIRLCPHVLNNDFRHPAYLARQAATLDLLSDGRLELGLGAGWTVAEYEESGIAFDRPGIRIERMAESIEIVRALFAGETVDFEGSHYHISGHTLEPAPPQGSGLPILVGGNGDRLLAVAAAYADIIGFVGVTLRRHSQTLDHFSRAGLADRIEHVSSHGGSKAERAILVQRVEITDDRERRVEELAEKGSERNVDYPTAEQILDSPFMLVGTVDEICEELVSLREELGVSYVTVFARRSAGFDEVVRELKGN
jgi:probable F420-dependent oxidoreductase